MNHVATIVLGPQALFREGMCRILAETSFRVILQAATLLELSRASLRAPPALCIVTPGGNELDQVDMVSSLRCQYPSARLVALCDPSNATNLSELFGAGANGCLPITMTVGGLVMALDLLVRDGLVIASSAPPVASNRPIGEITHRRPRADADVSGTSPAGALSDREREVLNGIVHGDSNKHIARRFDIAEATVKVHVRTLLRKIGVRNRTQAAIWAVSEMAGAPQGHATS